MNLQDIEMMIFNCPHTDSIQCDARLRCPPIPGYGSANPEFLVLGINPATRRGVWCRYHSLEELKHRYLTECVNPQFSYGRLLKNLEKLIPQFRIPETVYLTDVVKCPTGKGGPPKRMVEQCVSTYLQKTVRILNPKFIIGLGSKPSMYVGGFFSGGAARSRRIRIADRDYWFIAVPHPSRDKIETIAGAIAKKIKEPEADVPVKFDKKFFISSHALKKKEMGSMVEEKLVNSGYRKVRRNRWIRENQVVRVVHSSEFGRYYIRIWWREEWKDDHAVVYDYSGVRGPVCVVPIPVLFASGFVQEKRRSVAYANSGYWWSQTFPRDHELAKLVLSFGGRWDIL